MTLEYPGALWWLLLVPVILLLYILRTQRRRIPVASVRLWRGLEEELEARRNWRPPRPSWLLALQLAFVVAGALALAGPRLLHRAEGNHLVLVLDASASMGAADGSPGGEGGGSRFAEAQRQARERLAHLGSGDRATVIRAGAEARALALAAPRDEARAAVDGATVGEAPGDLRTALLLAGAAVEAPAGSAQVVVLSDGAYPAPALPGELTAPVEYVPIGARDANVAVTALALRRPPNGGPVAGFARVVNFGGASAEVPARLLADGLPLENRRLDLGPGASEELTFTLPPGTRAVALQLDATDLLAADNRAEARAPGTSDRVITLVAAQPDALARALRALPGVRVTTVAPDDYASAALAPLVVFDSYLPRLLPAADVIVVNPPAGGALDVVGEVRNLAVQGYDQASPLLCAVDPPALQFGRLVQLRAPSWATPVVWTTGGPAILEGVADGRRVVILAFDPRASNFPRLRAFPLLLANALDRLGWGEREGAVPAGQPVRLPPNVAGQVVEGPGGAQSVPPGAVAYADTERAGRYTVRGAGSAAAASPNALGASGRGSDANPVLAEFRVGLLAPAESNVRPRVQAPLAAAAAPGGMPAQPFALAGLLLVGALALSTTEWWWWSKGN